MMAAHAESPTPSARERVIVALDVPDLAQLNALLDRLEGTPVFYKVGLELFIAEGERALEAVRRRGGKIFLDLKLHDIPETVARAVTAARAFDVDMLTLHTSGGFDMMARAVDAAVARAGQVANDANDVADKTLLLLGVTVLTSLTDADLVAEGNSLSVAEVVRRRATLAARAAMGGIVCSPQEITVARSAAPSLKLVVPGVRPAGAALGDQKRVGTPASAITAGADYLVVGRPIRDASDPAAAFTAISNEVEQALRTSGNR